MSTALGRHTVCFDRGVFVSAYASVGGKLEGEGPLGGGFDVISNDAYFGADSWEKAESAMVKSCFDLLLRKAAMTPGKIGRIVAGDLLNQCTGTGYALRASGIPHLGVYGACSTMAESLNIGAALIEAGDTENICSITGSHFCSAERQFRFPLEYGGQRTPTSQWTVTAAGGIILSSKPSHIRMTHGTVGVIHDAGIKDANNMGAAMAPAAYKTLTAHFAETGRVPTDYDAIFTGDLGAIGHDILEKFFQDDGIVLGSRYTDCGVLIFNPAVQDVHSGGSGCGCCASVLASHILPGIESGRWKRVLFAATGALHSPSALQQGESIPAICHAIVFERV